MEREENLSRRSFFRIAAGAGATIAAATVGISIPKETQEPASETELNPITPKPKDDLIEGPTPSQGMKEKSQLRGDQIRNELIKIVRIVDNNPQMFSEKKREDLKMYYPIYKPVADRFEIDWYLIFIVHEAETGASAGTRGFAADSYYKGAMQLDPNIWDQDFIKGASKGLKYLSVIPQRHEDDWMQIAAGAKILSRNFHAYESLGKHEAVLRALRLYSSREQAEKRYKTYLKYDELFAPKRRPQMRRLEAVS